MKKFLIACGVALALPSAAAAGKAKTQPAITIPAAPADKGQVVFFRKGGLMGAAISCAVSENGQKVSSLPPGRFFVVQAEPGIHSYSVSSETKDVLRMEVEPGETYFAKCSVGMGIGVGRPNLAPSDLQAFQGYKLKLVKGATLPGAAAPAVD